MIRSAAYCRDYFSMDLIGGEESFEMFSHYEDSIYRYIYDLSGEKAQWDKVEIDTADPAGYSGPERIRFRQGAGFQTLSVS